MIPHSRDTSRPLIALALLASAMFSSAARAARLPDWAKAVVEHAPPLGEATPKETARVLFAETRVEVLPDGHMTIRRRFANQALSATAGEVGLGSFFWDDDTRVETSRAWHLPPGEKAEKSYKEDAFDVALGDAFLTDDKLRHLRMRGIKRGSIVFFEFTATQTPRLLSWLFPFYEGVPVLRTRYELTTPPGWTVRTAWLRTKGPDAQISADVRAWELNDLPGPDDQPQSERAADILPLLVVGVAPPQGVQVPIPAPSDWQAFAAWYEGIAAGRDEVGPEVAEAARRALASSGPALLERIQAAATFVRDHVRYIAKEVGIGGIQPRSVKETLSNLYGDCKDKGTLFRSILAAAGHRSYPVLINLRTPETVSDEIPAFWFNHFIVAVPVPHGEPVPERLAHAVVDGGDLGRLLFVDTTDEYLSIGWISSALAGKKGLVIAGSASRLVRLPDDDAAAHRLERRSRIEVRPDRSLSIERTTRYFGQFAALARFDYRQSSIDRRRTVERSVAGIWIEVETTDYSTEYEAPDGAFVETIAFRVPSPTSVEDSGEIRLFPDAVDLLPRVPLVKRTTPVLYDTAQTLRLETILTGVPASASLPPPQALEFERWSSRMTATRDGEAIRSSWEVAVTRPRFPPEAFGDLRKLWAVVSSASAALIDASPRSDAGAVAPPGS